MSVRCPDCGAFASYGNEIGHKSDCPSLLVPRNLKAAVRGSNLLERCREQNKRMSRNAILRQGDPVVDLYSFVMSEIARAADERFDDKAPLVLFFSTPEDRQELVDAIHLEKPGMLSKAWP